MDSAGCPAGFATDRFLLYGNDALACDMPVAGFIALATIIFVAKVFIAVEHALEWQRRRANVLKKQTKMNKAQKARLPIVPMLSAMLMLVYGLYFLLAGLNVATSTNGGSVFLFGLGWTLFGVLSILYLTKFVSLGYRIAPKTKSHAIGTMLGADKLNTFSPVGKVGLFLLLVMLVIQFVFLCIVPFVFNDDDRYVRSAFGIQGAFVCLQGLTVVNHFQRVKLVIQASRDANAAAASSSSANELSSVLKKMTHQQLNLSVCVFLSVALHVVVTVGVLRLFWFVPFLFMSVETTNFVVLALSNRCGRKPMRKQQVTDTASAERHGSPASPRGKTASSNEQGSSTLNKPEAHEQRQPGAAALTRATVEAEIAPVATIAQ